MARDLLRIELPFNHNLSRDACVIGTWHKHRVTSQHAVVADQAVHDRLIKRMPHVQRTRDIWGWKLNGVSGGRCLSRSGGSRPRRLNMLAGGKITSALPLGIPTGFDLGGFKAF